MFVKHYAPLKYMLILADKKKNTVARLQKNKQKTTTTAQWLGRLTEVVGSIHG